ncbi:MAG: vWA domain-containing protein, partial [Planctomycetota bacterium]|nr:vWA domain-containing protein [Planctomycetota bacterium]
VILVLDVSPSMRLQDGGPERDQSRMQRASDVMESFFKRVAIQQYKMSVVAVYSSAKPVVVETNDVDVVRNILNDLPMHYAFPVGKTDLFSGLNEAAALSKGWQPRSTTVIVISDGDTVPATGMPTMPASVSNVVVVGIGDPITGQFIDGRQSRQDAATLRQIAVRLGGVYHNGNANHLSSDLLNQLTSAEEKSVWEALGIREYALVVLTLGAATLLFLPLLLFYFGASPAWNRSVSGRGAARSLGTEG